MSTSFVDSDGVTRFVGEIVGGAPSTVAYVARSDPFSFDTPGLAAGITVYTVTEDSLILNAWVSIATEWNGTTPLGDLGIPADGGFVGAGLLNGASMDNPDGPVVGSFLIGPANSGMTFLSNGSFAFVSAGDLLQFWVSQDGARNGLSPGASQGQARVYLLLAPAPA